MSSNFFGGIGKSQRARPGRIRPRTAVRCGGATRSRDFRVAPRRHGSSKRGTAESRGGPKPYAESTRKRGLPFRALSKANVCDAPSRSSARPRWQSEKSVFPRRYSPRACHMVSLSAASNCRVRTIGSRTARISALPKPQAVSRTHTSSYGGLNNGGPHAHAGETSQQRRSRAVCRQWFAGRIPQSITSARRSLERINSFTTEDTSIFFLRAMR